MNKKQLHTILISEEIENDMIKSKQCECLNADVCDVDEMKNRQIQTLWNRHTHTHKH